MLEDVINQQWQALAQFVRGAKRLGRLKLRLLLARKVRRQKPSLADAIGRRRKANALEEYRRRFASTDQSSERPAPPPTAGQVFRELRASAPAAVESVREPAPPPPAPVQALSEPPAPAPVESFPELPAPSPELLQGLPEPPAFIQGFREPPQPRIEPLKLLAGPSKTEPPRPPKLPRQRRRKKADATAGSSQFFNKAWMRVPRELSQGKQELIAAAAACVIVFAGGFGYRAMKGDGAGRPPVRVAEALPSPVDERPKKPAVPDKKLYYERLPVQEAQTLAEDAPAAPASTKALAEPVIGGEAVKQQSANAPLVEPPRRGAPNLLASNAPTLVRSERYLPDGTRIDHGQPSAVPSCDACAIAEARATVAAAEPQPSLAADTVQRAESASPETPAVSAAAEPAQALAGGGFFAQVKSDQNQKAAEAELAAVAEKFKGILGEVPLTTRQADLKDRGIWFRVLAGPVKSHDEADNLCRRLKGAGIQGCIVQKLD